MVAMPVINSTARSRFSGWNIHEINLRKSVTPLMAPLMSPRKPPPVLPTDGGMGDGI
jgi:hypothetical protein